MATTSVAMIVRDCESTLGTALASIRPHVDEIVVVDTGSADDTRGVARRYADRVMDLQWPDHFGQARQYAHDHCSGDWVFFLDADDEVIGGEHLRALVDQAPADMDAYMIRYVLGEDPSKTPEQEFWRERLTRKGRMRWAGRVHEVMVPVGALKYERFDPCWVLHRGHGDGISSLQRNIRLLRLELEEHPDQPRALFYLGRDLIMVNDIDGGLALLEDYIPLSNWDDELFTAITMVGHALRTQGKYLEAYESDLRLLTVHPLWPQAWYFLAQDCYLLQRWAWCVHYAGVGRGLPTPVSALFQAPKELESGWMIFVTVALYHLGRLQEALDLTMTARALRPLDPHHAINETFFKEMIRQQVSPAPAMASA